MRTRIVDDAAPLSEQKIARLEKALGEPIPSAYRRFLLKHNGGSPETLTSACQVPARERPNAEP